MGILLEDLLALGARTTLTATEQNVLDEALIGLHYVWRMRIRNNLEELTYEICDRVREALLLFMSRFVKDSVFVTRLVPTKACAIAVVVFCGMLEDVEQFLQAVNDNMSATALRNALAVDTWLAAERVEGDDAVTPDDEGVRWTFVTFSVGDIQRDVIQAVRYLTERLDSVRTWEELVDPRAHRQAEQLLAQPPKSRQDTGPKLKLLAPKGQYWDTPIEKVVNMFRTNLETGLTSKEAAARTQVYGDNSIPPARKTSLLWILVRQLTDFIVMILIAAAIISAAIGDIKTAVVLAIVILLNTCIGFYQEVKAEHAISALASLSVPMCNVIRDGEQQVMQAHVLVPGDVVVLEEGNAVPADIRLAQVSQLSIIETFLTGESRPVDKTSEALRGLRHATLGDRRSMAYQSTTVNKGRGVGIVTNTGITTEIGKISNAISTTTVTQTPLQQKLAKLGVLLVIVALFACALVVGIGLAWDPKDTGIIKVGVSLALSVIPEGLVAIVTLTMALGMKRMAVRHALVRQLPAVETLGSVTTICSDKTGTITEGAMKTRLLLTSAGTIVSFVHRSEILTPGLQMILHKPGTQPIEALESAQPPAAAQVVGVDDLPVVLQWQMANMIHCNNSKATFDEKGKLVRIGDETEVALRITSDEVALAWPTRCLRRVHEIAFDSDRKRMAVVCEVVDRDHPCLAEVSRYVCLNKGATEVMLGRCSTYLSDDGQILPLTPEQLQMLNKQSEGFADQGLRTLALAFKSMDEIEGVDDLDMESDLTVIGMVGIADPPRQGLRECVEACHTAGIRVCMITGDHARTATAIAKSVSILPQDSEMSSDLVMNGSALASMPVEQLASLRPFPMVFSRVSPDHKLNIVKALQMRGDIVAMTGDGVNDAPAIRQANVGVAMGISGTDITRDAADIILADDNFTTIVAAAEEGRKIFDNIIKFIVYLLSCNLSEVLLMLTLVAIGRSAPLTAMQILYANIVVDIPPSLALGAEESEPNVMRRPPRDPKRNILDVQLQIIIFTEAASIALWSVISYILTTDVYNDSHSTASSVVFAVVFTTQIVHAFWSRSISEGIASLGPVRLFFENKWLFYGCLLSLGCVVGGMYIPGFNDLLELKPIEGKYWLFVAISVVLHFFVVELLKVVYVRPSMMRRRPSGDFEAEPGDIVLTELSKPRGSDEV